MLLDSKLGLASRQISLTPLIDVVFILLIFFILETSFIDISQITHALTSKTVDEPLIEPDKLPSKGQVSKLEIQLFSTKRLWVQNQQISLAELKPFIRQLNLAANAQIEVKASPYAEMQLIVSVLDVLKGMSLDGVQLKAL